jgi:nucleoside-diphosphate-sugar epimerase
MAAVVDNAGAARGGLVCVTGGSGFIGSWLVRILLDRGYTVHATVKNLRNSLFLSVPLNKFFHWI